MNLYVGDLIDDFEILSLLGEGNCSQVFEVKHMNTNKHYAMKVVNSKDQSVYLLREYKIYKYIESCEPFQIRTKYSVHQLALVPKALYYSDIDLDSASISCLVLTKCSSSNQSNSTLLKNPKETFLRTLNILLQLNQIDVSHNDLKPENILWSGGKSDPLYLVDFGLASCSSPKFSTLTCSQSSDDTKIFKGNIAYASVETMEFGISKNRVNRGWDDLESLVYIYYQLSTASGLPGLPELPWIRELRFDLVLEMKKNFIPKENNFKTMMHYIETHRKRGNADPKDYEFLRKLA